MGKDEIALILDKHEIWLKTKGAQGERLNVNGMNYEYEKANKSKVDGILNRFRQRKDKNVNDDENIRIK